VGPLSFINHSDNGTCTPQGHIGFHDGISPFFTCMKPKMIYGWYKSHLYPINGSRSSFDPPSSSTFQDSTRFLTHPPSPTTTFSSSIFLFPSVWVFYLCPPMTTPSFIDDPYFFTFQINGCYFSPPHIDKPT
jgi:hypothetical protein